MSYAVSGPLQAAVYQHLLADAALGAIVGTAIYDAVPSGAVPATYITLGEEDAVDRSDKTGGGAVHTLMISVISDGAGFATAKAAAGAVSDALLDTTPTLSRGRIVGLWFVKAQARRVGTGDQRRIDLRFRAQTEDI
ncbi:DUF3168 domain-containing protein [Oceaniglobus ichthyenteri]|uniref:DUF3168 domain-containing protein n=1 Tax=Oceaniglobus ichthyenteri TaxID=2136177 RepID=UPI000D3596D5|nr:DUF3168 domain-containing protein [Oceaniglobus ichthyenteri]